MAAFARIDHLICAVPNIEEAFVLFTERLRFPVAWPIGRFWPSSRTCGVALGGMNLEFIQPDQNPPKRPTIEAIVFEPTSLQAVKDSLESAGMPYTEFHKSERDPNILAMRGFQWNDLETEQVICDNVYPEPGLLPIRFFACQYGPFLKQHLAPANPRLQSPYGEVESLTIGLPNPARLEEILRLGYTGHVSLIAREHPQPEVLGIRLRSGPLDLGTFPAGFRFE